MATFKDQVLRIWDEWENQTDGEANNPDDFVDWALTNGKLAPKPRDIRRVLKSQVMNALRQATRIDADGITYRAKQCVRIYEEGVQMSLVFDTDKATFNLMNKATGQRRRGIVDDCYRLKCDVDHYNNAHFGQEQISLVLDFRDDVAELEAQEKDKRDDDNEAA
jgi:hypothetical protein